MSSQFPSKGWKLAIKLLGNTTSLNRFLYKGAFPEKNISGSYCDIYSDIFYRLFNQIPAKKSFFLQLLLLGSILYPEGNPLEANEDIFNKAKDNLRDIKITYKKGDVLNIINSIQSPIDFLSLSDVPSFLSKESEDNFLQKIRSNIAKQSIVIFRGHLRVLKPIIAGYDDITTKYKDILEQETTQLWTSTILSRHDKY
jgi:S-adenosylmethionine-diacylglycerol 3-amino-3-carboxypropyl transferase